MTKPSDESTREAWRTLQLGGGSSEFSLATLRLALDAGFGPVRLALGENGEPRLLIPTETGRRLPDGLSGAGVRASVVQYLVAGAAIPFIEVACAAPELTEVFKSLSDEILRRLRAGSGPELAVADAIAEFRELLMRGRAQSLEMRVGLFGELVLLNELLAINSAAGSTWTGPLGQRFDFSASRLCAEVKSTLQRSGSVIHVSNLEQLTSAGDGRALVLVHTVLEHSGAGGQSLRDLIDQTRQRSSAPELIDRALACLGLDDWRTHEVLADEKFRVLRQEIYNVGPGFPRLTQDSFSPGHPMPGVREISYAVDLAHARSFLMDPARRTALLESLASVA
jgi:putative PD-(D/E)XK family protein DUF4420